MRAMFPSGVFWQGHKCGEIFEAFKTVRSRASDLRRAMMQQRRGRAEPEQPSMQRREGGCDGSSSCADTQSELPATLQSCRQTGLPRLAPNVAPCSVHNLARIVRAARSVH